MKGTVFLLAGFHHIATDDDFAALRQAIERTGYKVEAVPISWKHRTMSGYIQKFKKLYQQKAGKFNIMIGNSFGAEVALLTAPELKPNQIILCSLSPFFQEDLPRFEPQQKLIKWFGPRRLADLSTISVKVAATKLKQARIPAVMLYGEQEKKYYKKLVDRVLDTAKDLQLKPIEIKGASHSFAGQSYVAVIVEVLSETSSD